jgi:hypothetical protein
MAARTLKKAIFALHWAILVENFSGHLPPIEELILPSRTQILTIHHG